MYNTLRRSDYPTATGYLDDLEIVCQSYHELLPQHLGRPNTLLVLDPPYVCTKQGAYRLAGYQTININASINKDAGYEDNLVFKF